MPFYKDVLKYYNKPSWNEQNKSYFAVAATLILLIALILLINPAIKHITKVNKEIADAKKVKTALENKLTDLNEAETNLAELSDDLKILDTAMPIGPDLGNYLKKTEVLIKKRGLKMSSVQFSTVPISKPKEGANLTTQGMSYTVSVTGSFINFQKFLGDVENFIRVNNVTTTGATIDEEKGLVETLSVTSYFLGTNTSSSNTKKAGESGVSK